MFFFGLSKWTKEKLEIDVMHLRNQGRESLNLANNNQENNQESDAFNLKLEHQKELYIQAQLKLNLWSVRMIN